MLHAGVCFKGPFDGSTIKHTEEFILLLSSPKKDQHQAKAAYVWIKNKWIFDDDLTSDLKKAKLTAKPCYIDLLSMDLKL